MLIIKILIKLKYSTSVRDVWSGSRVTRNGAELLLGAEGTQRHLNPKLR